MTKLLVIRHGQSVSNLEGYFTGHINTPLTEQGHVQAEITANYIVSNYQVDAVYTSDLDRAYNTGKAVADKLGLPVTKCEDLREIYAGQWEGAYFTEIPKLYPESYDIWLNDVGNATPDGGESVAALLDRIVTAVTRIAKENEDKTVVIACHGTPIRVLQCHCEGKTLDEMAQVPWVPNASVSTVLYENGKLTMPIAGYDKQLGDLASSLPSNV